MVCEFKNSIKTWFANLRWVYKMSIRDLSPTSCDMPHDNSYREKGYQTF